MKGKFTNYERGVIWDCVDSVFQTLDPPAEYNKEEKEYRANYENFIFTCSKSELMAIKRILKKI